MLSQTQARFLLYLALTPEKRDLVEKFHNDYGQATDSTN